MTALTHTGTAGFLARYDALRDQLPGDTRQREMAAETLRRAGLPGATSGRREEAWKYTSLRSLAEAPFQQSRVPQINAAWLPHIDAPRIVFVDGRYSPELSALPPSLDFARFSDFGTLARPEREPLV